MSNETSGGPAMTVPLWPTGQVPGALGDRPEDTPSLTVYLPDGRPASPVPAIVLCPGGGYQHLAAHEGEPVAHWANNHGAAAFVLKYRLAPRYKHPAMLQDVLRALRTVRARAGEWGVDAGRVAVLGFSAGGHLASTAATLFEPGRAGDPDPVERQSSRPDAAVLIYPVITLKGPSVHTGSRKNLTGDDPALLDQLSTDERVSLDTPPTFLVHSSDDGPVPIQNSLLFAQALAAHKIPFAMQVYETGGHGYGMGRDGDPTTSSWPHQCALWLRARGFLDPDRPE